MKRMLFAIVLVPFLSVSIADGIRYFSGGETAGLGSRSGVLFRNSASGVSCGTLCDSLVSYWSLDEASSTRFDAVGDNDLTDNNTVGNDTGMHNAAASFVRANDESLSKADFGWLGNEWTIAAWINISDQDGGGVVEIGDAWATSVFGIDQILNGTGTTLSLRAWMSDGSHHTAEYGVAAITPSANEWHLVIAWWDGTKPYIQYDLGTPSAGGAGLGAWTPSATADLKIGENFAGGANAEGLIDEVAIWSRVLSEAERTELYASGSGIFYDGSVFADLFLQTPWRYAANDNQQNVFFFRPQKAPLGLRALKLKKAS